MTQVADLLRDALGHLKVLDANGSIKAIDARDGIRALNLMMTRWEANGLAMGWSDVTDVTEILPMPPEAEEAAGYNLAIRLRARYGVNIEPDVIEMARRGLAELQRDRAVEMPLTWDRSTGYYNIRSDSYE